MFLLTVTSLVLIEKSRITFLRVYSLQNGLVLGDSFLYDPINL